MNITHLKAHEIWEAYSEKTEAVTPGMIVTVKSRAMSNLNMDGVESILLIDFIDAVCAWETATSPHDLHEDRSAQIYNCRVLIVGTDGSLTLALTDRRNLKPAENANA